MKSDLRTIILGIIASLVASGALVYFKIADIWIALSFAILIVIILLWWLWEQHVHANKEKSNVSLQEPFDLTQVRENEINKLVANIRNGKSCALVGAFSSEKTSILNYLRDEQNGEKLFDTQADTLIFSLLDISELRNHSHSQSQFWEEALIPIKDKIQDNSILYNAYQECFDNGFKKYYLEKLIKQIKQHDWQWVLMLDRFQMILDCSDLYCPNFLGSLRSLAELPNTTSSFSLVIAINQSLLQFHQYTRFSNHGSPYLNIIGNQITLGALPELDIDQLLKRGNYHFPQEGHEFIKDCAGEHPYLLQQAISILETEYKQYNQQERNSFLTKTIFPLSQKESPIEKAQIIFEEQLLNILQSWSPNIREAFISVTRNEDVSHLTAELNELAEQGIIKKNEENEQWQVRSHVFSQFTANQKVQALCDKKSSPLPF